MGLTARIGFALAANAVALLVVALVFEGVRINWWTFIIAVVIFSLVSLIVTPIVTRLIGRYAIALAAMASLLATFVALLITDLLSDSLDIEGVGTWIGATLIVWLATMIVDFVFGLFRRDRRRDRA
jgi:uncharacterized membrane protein YvlD (DUF360 family)